MSGPRPAVASRSGGERGSGGPASPQRERARPLRGRRPRAGDDVRGRRRDGELPPGPRGSAVPRRGPDRPRPALGRDAGVAVAPPYPLRARQPRAAPHRRGAIGRSRERCARAVADERRTVGVRGLPGPASRVVRRVRAAPVRDRGRAGAGGRGTGAGRGGARRDPGGMELAGVPRLAPGPRRQGTDSRDVGAGADQQRDRRYPDRGRPLDRPRAHPAPGGGAQGQCGVDRYRRRVRGPL